MYPSGVPIGGIGGGTIGRGFAGQFCRFQMTPGLYSYEVVHADQFILSVHSCKDESLMYQKVLSGAGNPGTLSAWDWSFDPSQGSYTGLYPRAWYEFNIPEVSLKLVCRQISPVIPHNYEVSKNYSTPISNYPDSYEISQHSSLPLEVH